MFCRTVVLLLALLISTIPLAAQSRSVEQLAAPLVFEPNLGQAEPAVRFLTHGNGHSFLLKDRETVLAFANPAVTVRMTMVGQNPNSRIEAVGRQSRVTNYFHGNDPSRWLKSVPNFEKIRYSKVYPGIDLIYYGVGRELEYDFEVQPHYDPSTIQIEFDGVDTLSIGPEGDLILATPTGEIRHRRPIAFQRKGDTNVPVEAGFVIRNDRVGFQVGEYDRHLPLTIDPTLVWSSFLGGTGNDQGNDVVVDPAGNAYVTGFTQTVSVETPPAAVTLNTPIEKAYEAFVTKFTPSGSVVYSTYFGGTPPAATAGATVDDEAHSIALDQLGNMIVVGFTLNNDFPIVNGFQSDRRGVQDAYIVKLDIASGTIQFSSYLGGGQSDRASGVAVDSAGNAYVAGSTLSSNFPIVSAFQPVYGQGLRDAFLTKVTTAGTIGFSTYLGGIGDDQAFDVAVDSSGEIIVTGSTSSINFPLSNALLGFYRGGISDIFITKFNAQGSGLVFSTYWGGGAQDDGVRLAVDSSNTIYITGLTTSGFDFPLKNPAQFFNAGVADAFLIKMHPDGRDVDFSTFIGAEDTEGGTALAIGSDGYIHIAGFTNSLGFYAINAVGGFLRGARDAWIMKLAPDASVVLYSSYLGGFGTEGATSIALDPSGNLYVTGFTNSLEGFPFGTNAFQGSNAGLQDGFITKINADDIKTSVPYTFPANGGARVSTAGLTARPVFGYVSVDVLSGPSPTGLAILDLRSSGVALSEVSIPVPVLSGVGRVYVTSSATNSTALTLVNPNDEEIGVDMYFTGNGTGTNVFRNFNIPAHGQVSGFVYAPPYNLPQDQIGTLTYTATKVVSAIALQTSQSGSPVNVYLPIMDPYTANMTPVTIPRFADGGGWSGTVYLVNPTEEVINGEIRFTKESLPGEPGLPFEVQTDKGTGSVFSYSIEPRQSYSLASHSAPVEIVGGHVDVVPTSGSFAPLAYAVLGFAENPLLTVTVEGVTASNEFKMYAEISGTFPEALATVPAVALANSSDSPATVTLTLNGFDGTDSGLSAVITLPPRGHLGRFLYEIPGFQNLPNPYAGVLRATTSQPGVTFAGFRARYNELARFMLTATGPLRNLGNTNPVVFPHLVDGGGYATQFIVINGTAGAGATGTIRYLDPTGAPLNLSIAPE